MTSLVKHAGTAWHMFDAHAREDFVVRPSMPILYFGDFPRYFRSGRKVVTVGLNPSYREFTSQGQGYTIGFRFPLASDIMTSRTANEQFFERYQESLNQYFEANPYWTWIRGKRCFVVMGRSTDRGPFSTLTNEEKRQLGLRIEALASGKWEG